LYIDYMCLCTLEQFESSTNGNWISGMGRDDVWRSTGDCVTAGVRLDWFDQSD